MIKGKTLSLQSDTKEDVFIYTIKDTLNIEKDEQQKILMKIPLEEFQAAKNNVNQELQPGASYELRADEGAIKDKGNNQLKNQTMGKIEIERQETEAVVQTGASTVKNIRANTLNIWAIAATLGVLAIVTMLLIWKSHKRKQNMNMKK